MAKFADAPVGRTLRKRAPHSGSDIAHNGLLRTKCTNT